MAAGLYSTVCGKIRTSCSLILGQSKLSRNRSVGPSALARPYKCQEMMNARGIAVAASGGYNLFRFPFSPPVEIKEKKFKKIKFEFNLFLFFNFLDGRSRYRTSLTTSALSISFCAHFTVHSEEFLCSSCSLTPVSTTTARL